MDENPDNIFQTIPDDVAKGRDPGNKTADLVAQAMLAGPIITKKARSKLLGVWNGTPSKH